MTNQLYRCPSLKGPTFADHDATHAIGANLLGSYGYNDWDSFGSGHDVTFALGNTIHAGAPVREAEVTVPADMIAFGVGTGTMRRIPEPRCALKICVGCARWRARSGLGSRTSSAINKVGRLHELRMDGLYRHCTLSFG